MGSFGSLLRSSVLCILQVCDNVSSAPTFVGLTELKKCTMSLMGAHGNAFTRSSQSLERPHYGAHSDACSHIVRMDVLVCAGERSHATDSVAYKTCLPIFSHLMVHVPRDNNAVCCKLK